jgi:hypothetical protein
MPSGVPFELSKYLFMYIPIIIWHIASPSILSPTAYSSLELNHLLLAIVQRVEIGYASILQPAGRRENPLK